MMSRKNDNGGWSPYLAGALAGILGAILYAELYPFFKTAVVAWKDYNKIGLPDSLGISPWLLLLFWLVALGFFYLFEKKNL